VNALNLSGAVMGRAPQMYGVRLLYREQKCSSCKGLESNEKQLQHGVLWRFLVCFGVSDVYL